jgi:SAM-dependent methyltransferase
VQRDHLKDTVREKYGQAATRAQAGERTGCCATDTSGCGCDPVSSNLYSIGEMTGLPEGAVLASLGCGNPTALAELRAGEIVLDLGSGGGIDVLLSARRVGPTGKAYGLDMTDEMLDLARENQKKAGVTNVEFLRGEIESVPLPRSTVDVVISNCVINLSADKRRVLAEAFRVLKPGGRFAVSDVVFLGEVPVEVKKSLELWAGCVAGALYAEEYRTLLEEVGFSAVSVEPTRIYAASDAKDLLSGSELAHLIPMASALDGKIASAFIRATKPAS